MYSMQGKHWHPGVLCNIGYPSETHLKLKSCEISFVHNICFNGPIGLKFCTEHGSDTAMPCAKFQSNWSNEAWVLDKRDFAKFKFKMNFRRISYIAQGSWLLLESVRVKHYCQYSAVKATSIYTRTPLFTIYKLHCEPVWCEMVI